MGLILNEKSLSGQFKSDEEFYATLPVMSRNLKILRERNISLEKHSSLYSRKITKDMTLYDLKNRNGFINPIYRAHVTKWKRELSGLMGNPPFWDDGESTSGDSVEEAARQKTDVLSFCHPEYKDIVLKVCYYNEIREVKSAVTTAYLLDILWKRGEIDVLTYIKKAYAGKRLVLDSLDTKTDSVSSLQKAELDELLTAFKRFEEAVSWDDIMNDRFFYFKSYKPAGKNYFANIGFSDRRIYKFRCGQHSQVRCFGYREEEKFCVILVERDHSISDTG